jgi:hypothetical protein
MSRTLDMMRAVTATLQGIRQYRMQGDRQFDLGPLPTLELLITGCSGCVRDPF